MSELIEVMSHFPLVSIVTPAYNQAEYLAETIESVLAQDYPNIEYIVLDDGSTDGTLAILQQYSGTIRWNHHVNMGQARTLNEGWARTTGKYMGYLSADDLIYPSAVRKLVEMLEGDDAIVCAFPNCDLIDNRSHVIKKSVTKAFDLGDLVVRQECHIGPGALFRRAAYDNVGGWKPELKLAPDREFWIRLAQHGRLELCAETLAQYRLHPLSISYKDVSEEVGREYIYVLNEYFKSVAIPAEIFARKAEAYGFAHMLLARNCLRAGQLTRGVQLYREACRFHPELSRLGMKIQIIRNVISKPLRILIAATKSRIRK